MRKTLYVITVCMCVALVLTSCKVETSGTSLKGTEETIIQDSTAVAKDQVASTVKALDKKTDDALVILDCALGDKPNTLGGDLGAWDKDPSDDTQSCAISFEAGADALGDPNGYALRIVYDVDSPNPAYNGFWTKLEGEDFSSYSVLNLYIKGDAAKGYTKKIKLEIKDFQNRVARYVLSGITDEWKLFAIPFEKIPGMKSLDLTSMNELVIVFDDVNSSPKSGSILVDHVSVSN